MSATWVVAITDPPGDGEPCNPYASGRHDTVDAMKLSRVRLPFFIAATAAAADRWREWRRARQILRAPCVARGSAPAAAKDIVAR